MKSGYYVLAEVDTIYWHRTGEGVGEPANRGSLSGFAEK